MKNGKWNAFRSRLSDKMVVFKRDEDESKGAGNLAVIICAALLFGLVISSITLAGQIKANKTAKETSKTVETVKLDVLNGGTIQKTIEGLSADMSNELLGVNDYLGRLDQKVLENLTKIEEVNTISEKNVLDLNESFLELKNKMDDIHGQITATQNDITVLLNRFEESVTRQEEAMANIADINTAIDNVNLSIVQINTDLNTTHQELVQILNDMKASNESNYSETISKLESIETNINDAITQDMTEITQQFTSLANNFKTEVENLTQAMNGQFDTLNQSLAQQFSDITSTINNNANQSDNSLKEYIDQKKAELQQDLNQVFTSVSNGKTNVASALLTKGVTVSNDATFEEIKDAILAIPQKIVIGVEQVPGTIVYHYHYHTDAAGNNPHGETNTLQGGCYTVAQKHVHSEDAGCYSIQRFHTHDLGGKCPGHSEWVDWDGDGYWGWFYECGDQPINDSKKVLSCSKGSGYVDYYRPSCGWVDGQITGAEISYEKAAVKSLQEIPLSAYQLPEGVVLPDQIETLDMIKIPDDQIEDMGLEPNGPSSDETETEDVSAEETETEDVSAEETETEDVSAEETETEDVPAEETETEDISAGETETEDIPAEETETEDVPAGEDAT